MITRTHIARPYASAIYTIAKQENRLNDWLNYLQLLTQFINNSHIKSLLLNPLLSKDFFIDIFYKSYNVSTDHQLNKLLDLLFTNKRINCLPDIFLLYEKIYQEELMIVPVLIESPYPLNDTDINNFKNILFKKFNKEISIVNKINTNLIGGVKIIIDDMVIDLSILNNLKKMTAQLLK